MVSNNSSTSFEKGLGSMVGKNESTKNDKRLLLI